jgi:hypothetical protein
MNFNNRIPACNLICSQIITSLLLLGLQLPKATALDSNTIPATEACSTQRPLTSTTLELSTWVSNPEMGVKSVMKVFGSHLFASLNLSGLKESELGQVWKGTVLPLLNPGFNFTSSIEKTNVTIDQIPLILIAGGKPITIHAPTRYQVKDMLEKVPTQAIAAVDGGFFSLKYLDSNVMIGPVLSQVTNKFVPGNNSENKKLNNRPLVLISPQAVRYIPFDSTKHNTLPGIQAEMPDVTDAFVGAAFLVRNGQPSPKEIYTSLKGSEDRRHRAFWGMSQVGVPTIGVSTQPVDSVNLGIILAKAGFKEAVMLDSGSSTALVYKGESLVGYEPRPVPHAVALVPNQSMINTACILGS